MDVEERRLISSEEGHYMTVGVVKGRPRNDVVHMLSLKVDWSVKMTTGRGGKHIKVLLAHKRM